jgi:hypothetical protein
MANNDPFDHLMKQMNDLNIKFNIHLLELQTQLDLLNKDILMCKQQITDNERDFKELKQHMNKIIKKYKLL